MKTEKEIDELRVFLIRWLSDKRISPEQRVLLTGMLTTVTWILCRNPGQFSAVETMLKEGLVVEK